MKSIHHSIFCFKIEESEASVSSNSWPWHISLWHVKMNDLTINTQYFQNINRICFEVYIEYKNWKIENNDSTRTFVLVVRMASIKTRAVVKTKLLLTMKRQGFVIHLTRTSRIVLSHSNGIYLRLLTKLGILPLIIRIINLSIIVDVIKIRIIIKS